MNAKERLDKIRANAGGEKKTQNKPDAAQRKLQQLRQIAIGEKAAETQKKQRTTALRPKTARQQVEDEWAQLRKTYDAGRTVEMQGIADNRSWEEIYAENVPREEMRRRIGYLESQLNRMDSDDYYKGVQERMAALDQETVDALDKLRKGMPTETVNMQGIADNRSWEEIYAEREAYDNAVRQLLREKGYDDSQIAQMADDRQRQVNRETYETEVAKSRQEAEETPFWASAKSVPQNLTGGLGALDLALQNAHKAQTGDDRPVDYYTPEMVGPAKR